MIKQTTNPSRWQEVPLHIATSHPLYGVKNWLAVFTFGVLMTPLLDLGHINTAAFQNGMSITELLSVDDTVASFITAALTWETIFSALILLLILTKHRLFRVVATWTLLASWPGLILIGSFFHVDGAGHGMVMGFFPWAVNCAIWVPYLQLSKRVRVTFEQQVKDTEPQIRIGGQSTPVPDDASHVATFVSGVRQAPRVATSDDILVRNLSSPELKSNSNEAASLRMPVAASKWDKGKPYPISSLEAKRRKTEGHAHDWMAHPQSEEEPAKKSLSMVALSLAILAILVSLLYVSLSQDNAKRKNIPPVEADTRPIGLTADEISGVFAQPYFIRTSGKGTAHQSPYYGRYREDALAKQRVGTEYKTPANDKIPDFSAALAAAERGHIESQVMIAWMYETGNGVKQDDKLALFWEWKAAIQGNPASLYSLGRRFEIGRDVKIDLQRANAWYVAAMERGSVDAAYRLPVPKEFGPKFLRK